MLRCALYSGLSLAQRVLVVQRFPVQICGRSMSPVDANLNTPYEPIVQTFFFLMLLSSVNSCLLFPMPLPRLLPPPSRPRASAHSSIVN